MDVRSIEEKIAILQLEDDELVEVVSHFKKQLEQSTYLAAWGLLEHQKLFPYLLLILHEVRRNPKDHSAMLSEIMGAINAINTISDYNTLFVSSSLLLITPLYYAELLLLGLEERLSQSSLLKQANHPSSDIRYCMSNILWVLRHIVSPEVLFKLCQRNVIRPLAYNEGYLALLTYLSTQESKWSKEAIDLLESKEVEDSLIGISMKNIKGIEERFDNSLENWLNDFSSEIKEKKT